MQICVYFGEILLNMAFILKLLVVVFVSGLAHADFGDFLDELGDNLGEATQWINNIQKVIDVGTDFAGALGTKAKGSIDRGNGCNINWSYSGQLRDFKWIYVTVCIDTCTGLTETVDTKGRKGAVTNCVQNLWKRIAEKEEL